MAVSTEYQMMLARNNSYLFEGAPGGASGSSGLGDALLLLNDYKTTAAGKNNARYVSARTQEYLDDIKTASTGLAAAFGALLGKNKEKISVFNEKSPVSSDSDVLSVSAGSAYKNNFTDMEITVKQAATGQKNTGADISSSGKSFQAGWNQIEIEINGKKNQISFNVSASDNNQAVQKKIAEAINSKNIGVKAAVSAGAAAGSARLEIESVNTGDDAKNKFTVRDITGGAVSAAGIGSVTQNAQNAIYAVNGGAEQVSKSNKIDLGAGVSATIKKASEEPVKVSAQTDQKNAINKVREMVNGFNALLDAAEENKTDKGANRLYLSLKGASGTYDASLSRIGVSVSKDGYLSIDADKMQKAADSGDLSKFFENAAGVNYGFAARVSQIAENVSKNPLDFLSTKQVYASKDAVSASAFGYLDYVRYSSLVNSGMLIDFLF